MKVALIGSNGTLATAFGKYCNQKECELHVYGRSKPSAYDCNSLDEIDLLSDKFDFHNLSDYDMIVYAAGAGIQSQQKDNVDVIYKLNVDFPVCLYNKLKECKSSARLITFGSYFEIGCNTENRCFSEVDIISSLLDVPNDYCISKRMLTRFFSSVENDFKFYHFILPTIYSEYENRNRLIPYVVDCIKTGKNLSFTSGEQIRQYLYVDDVPKIVCDAVENNIPNGIYNIEGSETLSVKELVCSIMKFFNVMPSESIFGTNERQDVGMKNLQLDGTKLSSFVKTQSIHSVLSVIEKY